MRARRLAPWTVRVAVVLVVAITGGGCTSSGSDNFAVGTLDPQRLATVSLLTIDAFPPPWRAVRNAADAAGFDNCRDTGPALSRGRQARLTSPEFVDGTVEQAEQSASVYDGAAGAALVMRSVRLPAFQRCLDDLLTKAARQNLASSTGAAPGTVPVTATVTPLHVGTTGAERVSYQVTVSTGPAARRSELFVDVDVMRVDRVVVALLSQRRAAPPTLDRDRLLRILETRIDAANRNGR